VLRAVRACFGVVCGCTAIIDVTLFSVRASCACIGKRSRPNCPMKLTLAGSCLAGVLRAFHSTSAASGIQYSFPSASQPTVEDVRCVKRHGYPEFLVGFTSLWLASSVNVTFVNYMGQRTTLPGRVGQTVLDVAQTHDYNWVECEGSSVKLLVLSWEVISCHSQRNVGVAAPLNTWITMIGWSPSMAKVEVGWQQHSAHKSSYSSSIVFRPQLHILPRDCGDRIL
jgi:hypothetical protein